MTFSQFLGVVIGVPLGLWLGWHTSGLARLSRLRKLDQWKEDMHDPVKRRAYLKSRGML
jgi:hypothetical protein